ncbi:response regulator [Hylemonella gracilis]|jgi:DNA-binding NtrC family response regulator|uniref:Response regulator n=1 Tax=Hylemonella gracilis TaxID=80880 RepID=A0A4P6UPP5_9BURK|nr:response regulator [Hylemonella gracilis]QBK05651.1 response regulator [Hylemonella gracilis]
MDNSAYASPLPPQPEPASAVGAKPLCALVVAHDPALKQQLVQALAAMLEVGSVRGAHTLETGLVAIDGGMVDLLVVDLDLPEEGGHTLIRHARRRLTGCRVLALATPSTAEARMPAAVQTGALGWLRVPASPERAGAEVAAQIRQLLAA